MSVKSQRGFTLVELIVFIVIVSVSLTAIFKLTNNVVQNSADPMLRKQSIAFADSLMEEVLAHPYSGAGGSHTTRESMDNVFDYNYFDGSSTAHTILGSQLFSGAVSPIPDTYRAKVAVSTVTVSGQALARVSVTVTNPANQSITLTGYRGTY